MNNDTILNAAIGEGQRAQSALAARLEKPLSVAEIHQRFNTLSKAREYIAAIQPSLQRLADEGVNPRQVSYSAPSLATTGDTPVAGEPVKTPPLHTMTLAERYRARVAAAEEEVRKGKRAVLEAPTPAAQLLAMRELRVKEQRLNHEKRNFR
jgi:hypothetical protein